MVAGGLKGGRFERGWYEQLGYTHSAPLVPLPSYPHMASQSRDPERAANELVGGRLVGGEKGSGGLPKAIMAT